MAAAFSMPSSAASSPSAGGLARNGCATARRSSDRPFAHPARSPALPPKTEAFGRTRPMMIVLGRPERTRAAPRLFDAHLDAGEAAALHAQPFGGRFGNIDEPPVAGAAIIDADDDRPAIRQIGDAQPRLEGQGRVGRGHLAAVEALAAGRAAPLERLAVPGGDAADA